MELEIKVCGNTEPNNLADVCALDPTYIGLIFYRKSKRNVLDENIIEKIKSCKVKRVGVFVNENRVEIENKIQEYKLDYVQLHGDETPEFCAKISKIIPVFKAFQINNNFNWNVLYNYNSVCNKFLFDAASDSYGGSGKKFNWALLNEYKLDKPFMLSGGISVSDAKIIIKINHPMLSGVDVNSGFEISPGIKNVQDLSSFIKIIRE